MDNFHHKSIKRFSLKGVIHDDSAIARLRGEYIRLVVSEMKLSGYVPKFDIDPDFTIDYNEKQKIFQEGRAFMNCEIIYPESVNVIPYGQSLIVFHGTMEYDDAGNPISENPQAGFLLANMIQDVNANVQDKFSIQGPPIQTLPKSKELKAKKPYYFNKINQLQKEYGLGDDSGISEYHQEWWSEWIDANAPGQLSKDEKAGLIKRWAFLDKGFRLKDIKDPAVREWADTVDKTDLKGITKENIMKFERIFLGVGADVLSFMTSVLTANPEVARKQMLTSLRISLRTSNTALKATA